MSEQSGIKVPNWLIDARVSSRALFSYVTLSAFADDEGVVEATNGQMSALIGSSVTTWIRASRELVGIGAITSEPIMDGNVQVATRYHLPHEGTGLDISDGPAPAPRRKQAARKTISSAKRLRVYQRDGFKCVVCGTSDRLSLDHIIPVSKGGTDVETNLQTMCLTHNMEKGAK